MTPRTFWDRDEGLWEEGHGGLSVRRIWTPYVDHMLTGGRAWQPKVRVEQRLGPLVPTC
jgi:hypothetical protein